MSIEKLLLFVPDIPTKIAFSKALIEQTSGEINIVAEFDPRLLSMFQKPSVYMTIDDDVYAGELSLVQRELVKHFNYVGRTRRSIIGSYLFFLAKAEQGKIGVKPGEINRYGDELLYFFNCEYLLRRG